MYLVDHNQQVSLLLTLVLDFTPATDIAWDQDAEGISFAGSGSNTYTLSRWC